MAQGKTLYLQPEVTSGDDGRRAVAFFQVTDTEETPCLELNTDSQDLALRVDLTML